jgi:hypothetical protein
MSFLHLVLRIIFCWRRNADQRKDGPTVSSDGRSAAESSVHGIDSTVTPEKLTPDRLETIVLGGQPDEPLEYGCHISFIGGPLDGYSQDVPIPLTALAATLAVPVNPIRLAAFHGDTHDAGDDDADHPTSVAFYQLDKLHSSLPRYLFLGAARPQDTRAIWTR